MRHERITIVVLSYIIGFSTAFIAFGVSKPILQAPPLSESIRAFPTDETSNVEPTKKQDSVETVVMNDGLYALIGDEKRVLSAQVIDATEPRDSFHYRIIDSGVSPNKNFVYFCSQQIKASVNCLVYIYESSTDRVYKVKDSLGNNVALPLQEATLAWSADGTLNAGVYKSESFDAPWKMK